MRIHVLVQIHIWVDYIVYASTFTLTIRSRSREKLMQSERDSLYESLLLFPRSFNGLGGVVLSALFVARFPLTSSRNS